jgi:PAS domain S-box-containing protein
MYLCLLSERFIFDRVKPTGRIPIHKVQFYEEDVYLISSLADFLIPTLKQGGSALIIATPSHRIALIERLAMAEFDIHTLEVGHRLVLLDASLSLAQFMVDGDPDERLFRSFADGILARIGQLDQPIRAFGEMVAILWMEGNEAAALKLEDLWEAFLHDHPVELLCAYPLRGINNRPGMGSMAEVCAKHTHTSPSESYSAPGLSEEDRLRAIVLLQEKAAALEAQTLEMDRQLGDLRQLHEVSLRLSSFTSQEESLREVLRYALTVYRADKGLLSLSTPDKQGLRVGASVGFTEKFLKMIDFVPTGAGACGYCQLTETPVIIECIETDPIFEHYREVARIGGFRSVHSIPLITREGKVIGVLSAHFNAPRRPSEREMKFAELFARLAADSIEQTELRSKAAKELEQRRAAEARLQEHAETLEILNRTSAQLVAERDLEKILQAVTDAGKEITLAAFGAFFYTARNENGDAFSLYTLSGAPKEAFSKFPSPRETAIFGPTFDGKGPMRFDDVTQQPEYGKSAPFHGMPEGHLPVRSYLAVPVVSRSGEVQGGLFYGHPQPGVFTERSERLLQNLAAQAAVAIDNARLYLELQQELKQRKIREEAAQKFLAIVSSSNDAIISKDLNSLITSWNKAAERIFGYKAEEVIGQPISLLHPADHASEDSRMLERILKGETISHYETVRRRKDGTILDISLTVSPIIDENGKIIGASKIARDITALKSTEEQLRQAQKLEAVGRLAGGIAHDFNNLLTSINGFTEMALAGLDRGTPLAGYLEEVRKSGERAATLTQQLLSYSRKQTLAPKIIDLNTMVTDMEKMLRRLIGEDIAFKSTLEPDLGPVKADPGQLQQLILNLVVNARDAMPSGGSLSFQTANVFLDPEYAATHLQAAPGHYVMLAVGDSGSGMAPEVLAHVFEPFFTTKEVGKGSGLGLSSVYGMVKQSGGGISVSSEPGRGTTFKIYFPAVESPDKKARTKDKGEGTGAMPGETILLAEDEAAVRKFLTATLRNQGYRVLEACDGAEALEIGRNAPRIDLLLTDVVMPNMNGGKLAEAILVEHPGLKILFISGYAQDVLSSKLLADSEARFLQKPFTQAELFARIREIISSPPAEPSLPLGEGSRVGERPFEEGARDEFQESPRGERDTSIIG